MISVLVQALGHIASNRAMSCHLLERERSGLRSSLAEPILPVKNNAGVTCFYSVDLSSLRLETAAKQTEGVHQLPVGLGSHQPN